MAVAVQGLSELQRAFRIVDKGLAGDLKDALAEAAAPVRSDAQALAVSNIRKVDGNDPWRAMRIGVGRSVVYVAPVERGLKSRGDSRRRRPNFGNLLMDRALQPALDMNVANVERRLGDMLDELCDVWGRV